MVNHSQSDIEKDSYPSMPHYAPLYPELPIQYKGYRRLSVFCEGRKDGVKHLLPDFLDYESNMMEVFVLHAPEVEGVSEYWEGGLIVQASFRGTPGGYMAAEFVTSDAALGIGREIHGHPKKMADVKLEEDDVLSGTVSRNGKNLFRVSLTPGETEIEVPALTPRYQDRRIPSADGQGYDLKQVLEMNLKGPPYESNLDVKSDEDIHSIDTGCATVEFNESTNEPFATLGPNQVHGGTFIVRDFDLGFADRVYDLSET